MCKENATCYKEAAGGDETTRRICYQLATCMEKQ